MGGFKRLVGRDWIFDTIGVDDDSRVAFRQESLMKILLIASHGESVIPFRGEFIRTLVTKGWGVTVAASSLEFSDSTRKAIEAIGASVVGVPLQRTGTNPVRDIALLWQLYMLMRHIRPDIVISYTIKPVIYGSLAAWLARVPRRFALVTGLGNAFFGTHTKLKTIVIKKLYLIALRTVHKVFFQNPDDERFLRSQDIFPRIVPSVILNGSGVNLIEYPVHPMDPDRIVFLMIARLIGGKGVREFVEASKQVRSLHPNTRCCLVGWIDENPDAISQLELDYWVEQCHIQYLGRLSDVRPAIADCNIFVLPSYYGEGTPRTVLEAMAMGRAIITTDAPGCRETVIEGQNGFLIPVRDVDALVSSMLKFIGDPDLATRMGRRSREIAEDKYDVHKVNAVMLREMGIA